MFNFSIYLLACHFFIPSELEVEYDKMVAVDSVFVCECSDMGALLNGLSDFEIHKSEDWRIAKAFFSDEKHGNLTGKQQETINDFYDLILRQRINRAKFVLHSLQPIHWSVYISRDLDSDFSDEVCEFKRLVLGFASNDELPSDDGSDEEDWFFDYEGKSVFDFGYEVSCFEINGGIVFSNKPRELIDRLKSPLKKSKRLFDSRKYSLMKNHISTNNEDEILSFQIAPQILYDLNVLDPQLLDELGGRQLLRCGISLGLKPLADKKTKSIYANCYFRFALPASHLLKGFQEASGISKLPAYPNGDYWLFVLDSGKTDFWGIWQKFADEIPSLSANRSNKRMSQFKKSQYKFRSNCGPLYGKVAFKNPDYPRNGMMTITASVDAEAESEHTLDLLENANPANGPKFLFSRTYDKNGNIKIENRTEFLPAEVRFGYLWFDRWLVSSNPKWLSKIIGASTDRSYSLDTKLEENIKTLERYFQHEKSPFFVFKSEPFFLLPYLNEWLLHEAEKNALEVGKKAGIDLSKKKQRDKIFTELLEKLKKEPFAKHLVVRSKIQSQTLGRLYLFKTLLEHFGRTTLIASTDEQGIKVTFASFPIEVTSE